MTIFDSSALSLLIQEGSKDGRYRPSPTLMKLNKVVEYQSAYKWNVTFSGATTTGRAASANPVANNSDIQVGASLPIGSRVLSHTFSVLKTDVSTAISAAPKGVLNGVGIAVASVYRRHLDSAFKKIFQDLDRLIFTGDGSNASHGIFGLNYIASAANASYAGITSATYPEWVSYINTNATARPLTRALFDDIVVNASYTGMSPQILITSPKVVQNYKGLFAADRSLTTPEINGKADIGFTGQSFEGIEIVGNPNVATRVAADSPVYFLDLDEINFISFDLTNAIALENKDLMNCCTVVEPKTGLSFFVGQLPASNPLATSYEIGIMPQLAVENRSKGLAVLDKITQ